MAADNSDLEDEQLLPASSPIMNHPVLCGLIDDLQSALSRCSDRLDFSQKAPAHKRDALSDANRALEEAQSLIKSMEVEQRALSTPLRAQLNEVLPILRAAYSKKHSLFEKFRTALQREELNLKRDAAGSKDMKAIHQIHQQNSSRLEASRRQLSDIENVGSDIMIDLRRQRDILTNSKSNLEETDSWVDSSRRILRSMAQQAMLMSGLWYLTVFFLLGALVHLF